MMRVEFLSSYILIDFIVLLILPYVIHFSLMLAQCSVCGDRDCAWEIITMCLCKVSINPIMLKKELCMVRYVVHKMRVLEHYDPRAFVDEAICWPLKPRCTLIWAR